jgi:mono/diheme cytochrome c family protein
MKRLWLVSALLSVLLLGACDQYHMIRQQKAEDDGAASALPRGQTNQPPVAGTVARGELDEERQANVRPPMNLDLLERGHERFDIYCSPCHGGVGDGQGMIPSRGFPHPPSFHQDRLRQAPDSHFLEVMRDGYGAMYSYAARVPPGDRWAILAYIRALQVSQNLKLADLPDDLRQALPPAGGRPGGGR